MRALLTGGIKAILAIAALSTAAHWALRVQRDGDKPSPVLASLPDPATTGSIEPRRIERPAPRAEASAPSAGTPARAEGFDQIHLAALIAGTAPAKSKAAKPAVVAAKATPGEKAVPAKR